MLVYTTQVNSTFRARWLASSEVISQVLFTSELPTKNKMAFVGVIVTKKVALWAASYSACVVYTKTIIHLSVSESGGYLPRCGGSVNIHHYSPPLRWIIVNYLPAMVSPYWEKLCPRSWLQPSSTGRGQNSKVFSVWTDHGRQIIPNMYFHSRKLIKSAVLTIFMNHWKVSS